MASSTLFNNEYLTVNKLDTNTYMFRFVKNPEYELQKTTYDFDIFKATQTITDTHIEYAVTLDSVQTIEQLIAKKKGVLGYNDCLAIVNTMGTQLQKLDTEQKHIFASMKLKNILVLNDIHYMYISDQDIIQVNEDESVTIDYALPPTIFSSPEQSLQKSIPHNLHKNTWLFSFASMVTFCLTGNPSSYEDKTFAQKEILLEMIETLPLYYCLLRCLYEDPFKRTLIYI